jgi:precorrin-6B methylase 2
MRYSRLLLTIAVALIVVPTPALAQLGGKPAEEWIKSLDGPQRVADLKIEQVVSALKLQPGQVVADIGAGSGLLEVPLARAVGPQGRVYAVDIDAGFFPEIRKRTAAEQVTNVETVLGKFTDPALPAKNVDLALFHDVMHHVQERAAYLKTLAAYLAPTGRIAVVDYEGGVGPHRGDPSLQASREQLVGWMKDAGFRQVDDVKLFTEKYYLVFARQP